MDQNVIYAKTPIGDEAVRQSTRVVQRNLRMVLVQVDGKMSVGELAAKIGNPKLVEAALEELEKGGYIAPTLEAASVWEEALRNQQQSVAAASPASQFSTFGPKSLHQSDSSPVSRGIPSVFSTFGKPITAVDEALSPDFEEALSRKRKREETASAASERPPFEFRPVMVLWAVLVLVATAVATVLLYPYGNSRAGLEAALGRAMGGPVSIESISLGLEPRPGLYLRNLRIGEQGDSRIAEIRLPSPVSLMFGGQKTLNGLEIYGATLTADRLAALSSPPAAGGGDGAFVVGQVAIKDLKIALGDLALSGFTGDAYFKPAGGLDRMNLQDADRTLRIEAQPNAMGLGLNIVGQGWKPVADRPFVFDAMQAKAVLQRGKLIVQDLDTGFLGGVVKGSWLLEWSQGLLMAGDASLARLNARLLGDGLGLPLKFDGEVNGSLRLRGSGAGWKALWSGAEAVLDGEIARGNWLGVDLGEAARRGVSRSGNTKFDSLKGNWRFAQQQLAGRDLRLGAGLLNASGSLSASAGADFNAALVVTIGSSLSTVRAQVRIAGGPSGIVAEAGR